MHQEHRIQRWGALCALVAGIAFSIPLLYVFVILPAAGSSATHALDPEAFLPWMAGQGQARVVFWWVTALPFLLAAFGVPAALHLQQRAEMPVIAAVSRHAAYIGLLTCGIASLMLAAGEMSVAQAYVSAQAQALVAAQHSLVAFAHWQRVVIGLIFDFLGFLMLGIWIGGSSIAGLRIGNLPKALSGFGMLTAGLCGCFALGHALHLDWLGEFGIGGLAFFAVPTWLVWVGLVLWKAGAREAS